MKYALVFALVAILMATFHVHQEYPQVWDRAVLTTNRIVADVESIWTTGQSPQAPPPPAPAVKLDPMEVTKTWTSITTRYGQTISITMVTAVDAHSVHYQMTNGAGSVEISDLPNDVQQALNYDPVAGKQAVAAQQEHDAQSDAVVARVSAEEQRDQSLATAAPASPDSVSDAAYQATQSDLRYVSGYVTIDPGTGYVQGDAYWVKRYWDDRRRKDMYERQSAARAQVATTADNHQSNGNYRSETGNQQQSGSTFSPRPTPAPAPRPAPISTPARVAPRPVSSLPLAP